MFNYLPTFRALPQNTTIEESFFYHIQLARTIIKEKVIGRKQAKS